MGNSNSLIVFDPLDRIIEPNQMSAKKVIAKIKQKTAISGKTKDAFKLVLEPEDEIALRKIITHISEDINK